MVQLGTYPDCTFCFAPAYGPEAPALSLDGWATFIYENALAL